MIHGELSGKIIGAGMDVLNELRPGLDEKLYERAMIIELKRRGHSLSIQRAFPVFCRGELIGNLIPDLIVDDAVIVDPKVAACFYLTTYTTLSHFNFSAYTDYFYYDNYIDSNRVIDYLV